MMIKQCTYLWLKLEMIKFKFFDVVNKKFIIFRALLSGISDNITPEWGEQKYIGRPDQVYVYQGADRKVSFTFDIYPKSVQELPLLMEKLNYLIGRAADLFITSPSRSFVMFSLRF